jgi:hypothetical protein
MTIADFLEQHPWWSLLYLLIVCGAIKTRPLGRCAGPRKGE